MAARGKIDAQEAQRLIDAPKDGAGQIWGWSQLTHPGTGAVIRKNLQVSVAVTPEPDTGHLLVIGTWRRHDAIQIRLVLALSSSELNLARLCLNPRHAQNLHWHLRDEVPGPTEQVSVSHPPGMLVSEESMLFDVFIPTMKITNVAQGFSI